MDKQRQGEIALLLFKRQLRREGLKLDGNFARELGNTAKDIGVSVDELRDFAESILPEMLAEALGYHKVGLTLEQRKQK